MPDRISHALIVPMLMAVCVSMGCASPSTRGGTAELGQADMSEPPEIPEELLLDVGVTVFEAPGPVEGDGDEESVFQNAEVLRAERNYVPYVVGKHLQAAGEWGAVRILTRPSTAIDVTVTGSITRSDGETLAYRAQATDARGVQWFDNEYQAFVDGEHDTGNEDPFADAYAALAADMVASLRALSLDDLARIRAVAELAFAQSLAPEAFAKHVAPTPDGGRELRRLPAADDPMLGRVREIRHRERLFIDRVNDHYDDFTTNIQDSYDEWRREAFRIRRAQRELTIQADTQMLLGSARIIAGLARMDHDMPRRTGFDWVTRGLGLIRSAEHNEGRIRDNAQSLREVGSLTEANLLPQVTALENRTTRLQRGVDSRYDAVRQILHRIYLEEIGLPPNLPQVTSLSGEGQSAEYPASPKTKDPGVLPPPVSSVRAPTPSVEAASFRSPVEERTLDAEEEIRSGNVEDALNMLNQLLADEDDDLGALASARLYTVMALGHFAKSEDQEAVAAFNQVVGSACETICSPGALTRTSATERRRVYMPSRPAVFEFIMSMQRQIADGNYDAAIESLGGSVEGTQGKSRSTGKPKMPRVPGTFRLRATEQATVYQVLARAYVAKRDYPAAIDVYERLLDLGTKVPSWHRDISTENLALIHFFRKDYGKSLKYLRAWLGTSKWVGEACPKICPAQNESDAHSAPPA